MQIDRQVVKQTEITLKHLAKDIRSGQVEAGKVSAFSKLIADYSGLIKLSQEDDSGGSYYDRMEAEALGDMNLGR